VFGLIGTTALLIITYLRPQEVFPALQGVPLLHACCALALSGMALDLKSRLTQLTLIPQLPWAALYLAWNLVTVVVKAPQTLATSMPFLLILLIYLVVIGQGAQSFFGLRTLAGVVVVLSLTLTAFGIHQRFSPTGCVEIDRSQLADVFAGKPDGRRCETIADCQANNPETGA
jgi:hypothetical protein